MLGESNLIGHALYFTPYDARQEQLFDRIMIVLYPAYEAAFYRICEAWPVSITNTSISASLSHSRFMSRDARLFLVFFPLYYFDSHLCSFLFHESLVLVWNGFVTRVWANSFVSNVVGTTWIYATIGVRIAHSVKLPWWLTASCAEILCSIRSIRGHSSTTFTGDRRALGFQLLPCRSSGIRIYRVQGLNHRSLLNEWFT